MRRVNNKRRSAIAKRKARKREKNSRILNSLFVVLIAFIFVAIFAYQASVLHKENEELKAKQTKYEIAIAEEKARTEELEDERVRTQTKEYVEEEARKLGYIYPDEVILKPNDNN